MMKLSEILGDWLIDLPIVEQASKRNLVMQSINSLSKQVIIHLIKIYRFDNPIDIQHHMHDIDIWLDDINDYKLKNNKYPSANDYYQWMFSDLVIGVPYITKQVKLILKKYKGLPMRRTDEEVYHIINDIINKISYDMAIRKFNSIDDYIDIDTL
jgi:hypothetical protein